MPVAQTLKVALSYVPGAPFVRGYRGMTAQSILPAGDKVIAHAIHDKGFVTRRGACPAGHELTSWQSFRDASSDTVALLHRAYFSHNLPIDRNRVICYEDEVDLGGMRGSFLGLGLRRVSTAAYLSNTVVGNHAHWLTRSLPLLSSYASCLELAEIPFFWTGDACPPPAMLRALDVIGIGKDRLLHGRTMVDSAYVAMRSYPPQHRTSLCGMYLDSNGFNWVRQALSALRKPSESRPRKVYIRRGAVRWRQAVNEEDIVAALQKNGFSCISLEGMSLDEQASIFASAEVIVAPHGAALANLVFAQEGVRVIEIMPRGYDQMAWFYPLCCYLSADYRYMVAETLSGTGDAASGRADMRIDISTLLELIC